MSVRFQAAEIFKVLKGFDLAEEKIRAIELAPIDSPTLVVAGAGSGKTELLAFRVLWLVANGLVRPEQILGLTFTKKAAVELTKRIYEGLVKLRDSKYWPEDLEVDFSSPNISTYNAFANQIFRDNALSLGYESEAKLLSEASAFEIAREVCISAGHTITGSLSDLEMNLPNLVEAVLAFSASMNDNQVSSQQVTEIIEQTSNWLLELPKSKGKDPIERNKYIEELVLSLKPTPLLAELAERYQEEKRSRSVLDYSDQVSLALKALRTSPDALARLRETYQQVLLDEYQDTSFLQTKLLSEAFGNRAVFAVGDPNQSIYGWRGASASNLDEFALDFGSASNFALATSWRNPREILAAANQIALPLAKQASFETPKPEKDRVLPVTLAPMEDAKAGQFDFAFEQSIEDEARKVANWLAPASKAGKKCAVLMRKRSSMSIFVDALEAEGLEVEVVGLGGLMELPEIVDLVSALCVVQRQDSGTELIRLLTGARWRIGIKDIDRLNKIAKKLSGPKTEGNTLRVSLVEALDATLSEELRLLDEFSGESLSRLREAARLFQNLRSATSLPLVDYVRMVAEELLLDIELRANPKLQNPLAHLKAFYEIVSGYGSQSAAAALGPFLNWLDFAKGRDRFEPPKFTPSSGVVQVLTVHSAKGLEWDFVAVPNLIEDDFPSKPKSTQGWLSGKELPFPLRGDYSSLPKFDLSGAEIQQDAKKARDAFVQDNREYLEREENRLAYVAITRAKSALLLSGSYWKPGNLSARKPSRYFLELAKGRFQVPELLQDTNPLDQNPKEAYWPLDPLGETHRENLLVAEGEIQSAIGALSKLSEADFVGKMHEEIDLLFKEQDDRLKRLSEVELPVRIPASKFKDFVKDPGTQAGRYLRPLPSEPYRATRLGTEFHSWVEEFLVSEIETETSSESISDLKQIFRNSRFSEAEVADVEIEIHLTKASNTFICKLDAVFKIDGRYQIVDWKTGEAPDSPEALAAMTYQLALYRFAYSTLKNIPPEEIGVSFFFVSENKEVIPEYVPSSEELLALWQGVIA